MGLRALAFVAVVGMAGAVRAEEPARRVAFRDLAGELAEVADEVAASHSAAELQAPWHDELVDLLATERVAAADLPRARRVMDHLRAYRDADRVEILGRRAAGNVATNPRYRDLVRATRWAPPFLVVATDGERVGPEEAFGADDAARRTVRARLRDRQAWLAARAERCAAVANRVHADFLRRFGEPLHLKPLTDPYGGRPDLPRGVRSFAPGVPLVVVVFEDARVLRRSFGNDFAPSLGFDPRTGWLQTHAEGSEGDVARRLTAGVAAQLLHWFTRQRRGWRVPRNREVLEFGFSAWNAGVRLAADGTPTFTGVDPALLEQARLIRDTLAEDGKPYPLHSLEVFFGTDDWRTLLPHRAAGTLFGAEDPRTYAQRPEIVAIESWAFWLFLDESGGGRRRDAFLRLLDALLDGKPTREAFRTAFPDPSSWEALDADFRAFFLDDLLRRDPASDGE